MDSDELRIAHISTQLHSNILLQLQNLQSHSPSLNIKSLLFDLHQFQPCPQLLDQHLDNYIDLLLKSYFQESNPYNSLVCEAFYTFGKIIGVKRLLGYMKTEIELIPFIVDKLSPREESLHWHEQYLLLCCLIVLGLTPFDLNSFGQDIKGSIYEIGVSKIKALNAGPLQSLGSRLIGTVVMRSDCTELIDRFVDELITQYDGFQDIVRCGYLESLNISLQKDANELKLIDNVPKIYEFLRKIQDDEDSESKLEFLIKIYCKLAKYFTELDELDRIDDIIEFFDKNFNNKSTTIRSVISRNFTKLLTKIDDCLGIDIMIDILYSTKELFENQAMEIIDANFLHTQLLIIAELLYRDAIDQVGVKQIKSILSRSLFFQQIQITHISGSNVRDSSNYIIWALSRTSLEIPPDVFLEIFTNLLLCCCFDKELMIRRSSTAALQELIGRHGSKNWAALYPKDTEQENSSKNVDILQVLDFVELSSVKNSFLNIPLRLLKILPDLKEKFIDFLSHNVLENLDNEITKLSAKSLAIILRNDIEGNQQTIENRIAFFTAALHDKTYHSFIGLSEILPLFQGDSSPYLPEIYQVFNSQKLDHHKNPPFIMESYLQLSYTLLKLDPSSEKLKSDSFFTNLFDLIRVDSDTILEYLKLISPLMSLSKDYLNKWIYYMKNNNLNASSAVCFLQNFSEIITETVSLLDEDNRVNANVKTAIIHSFSDYLQRGNQLEGDDFLVRLIGKLDDYSISEQGDVGSKIRTSTISLISENLDTFHDLRNLVEMKLLRLAGEPIDSIRDKAIKLLLELRPTTSFSMSEFETRNHEMYFNNLLVLFSKGHYISDKSTTLEFWKGYTSSGGAIRSTNELISGNLRAFIRFYSQLPPDSQTDTLLKLASLVKLDVEEHRASGYTKQNKLSKTVLVALQFLSRILQLNIHIPATFNVHGLYVRIHNVHLNTTNMTKLSNAVKIFGSLYLAFRHEESLKRLCWLCCHHTLGKVRTLASEELFTIYSELNLQGDARYGAALRILRSNEWNKLGKLELKKLYGEIYITA